MDSDAHRALSFGSDAETYHRHRPGYPDALVDLVVAHAGVPVARALEVGAGTGLATAVFAARGIEVVAVEPDPGMRAVLVDEVDGHPDWLVSVLPTTFEQVDPHAVGQVDLLYAAAAFHWTDPATRWDRVSALVRPAGVLALFGGHRDLADDALREEVDALADAELVDDLSHRGWTLDDLRAQPGLTDAVEQTIERRTTMAADDFVTHLSTVSAYRVLAAERRDDLLARVRAALPGTVEVTEDLVVHLARRAA